MELIEGLETKREEMGMNMTEFASLLKLDRVHYNLLVNKKRPVGDKVRKAAIRHFPDLAELVIKSYEAVA